MIIFRVSGVNGQVVYSVIPGNNSNDITDGYGFFSINLPHQGLVTVNRSLDYERSSLYHLTILATVRKSLPTQMDALMYEYIHFKEMYTVLIPF